jgi:DNA-binding beta-propeller fold protein YncE
MAGPHQIWKMPLDESEIGPYAGNGRENIVDGPLLPSIPYDGSYSSFAQPSGLTSDGTRLFVADSEGSTIRSVPFDPAGDVQTLVGLTGTLFDFGDVDGVGREVRLQHALGVAWWDGKLYVADTYNNKIKVIDVDERSCRTVAGSGAAGKEDAEGAKATFNEPAGLSAAGGKLYVADTNNHAIRVMELAAPYRVSTVEIEGLAAPKGE